MKTFYSILACLLCSTAFADTNLITPPIGHSCGINSVRYTITINGFDVNYNIQGTVVAHSSCGGSGRDPRPTGYKQTAQVTWDTHGLYTLSWVAPLAIAGSVDSYGDSVVLFGNGGPIAHGIYVPVVTVPYVPVRE